MIHARAAALPLAAAGALACLLTACGSENTPAEPPSTAATVTVTPPTASIPAGQTQQFSAQVKDAKGNVLSKATVAWSSSDSDAVAVSTAGLASAYLPGTAKITATSGSVSSDAQLTITAMTAIQLSEGGTVGKKTFPDGSTASGGNGSPVGGIECGSTPPAEHYHAHLSLFASGEQIAIPRAIGIQDPILQGESVLAGSCFYWLHTHDYTGIIHVEPPATGHTFTLGQFFDIWGQPLASDKVATYTGAVTVYVDGKRYTGDPRAIVLTNHQQITLEVGTPRVAPPVYAFPAGY
jgi:hypothetical protein